MRRVSWYATAEAVAAVDGAVEAITARLGPDAPKHVALSALLTVAAAQADAIAAQLLAKRAADLAKELERLGGGAQDG